MTEGFLRQRRNLILSSLILFFVYYAEVEIEKLSFFGIELKDFGNPEAAVEAIWLIYGYFFIRYFQYFLDEGYPIFLKSMIGTLDEYSARRIAKIVKKSYPENTRTDVTYSILKGWKWEYSGQNPPKQNPYGELVSEGFKVQIKPSQLWKEYLLTLVALITLKSSFTDYILPVFLAAFVPLWVFW